MVSETRIKGCASYQTFTPLPVGIALAVECLPDVFSLDGWVPVLLGNRMGVLSEITCKFLQTLSQLISCRVGDLFIALVLDQAVH